MIDNLIAYYDEKKRKKVYWEKIVSIGSILLGLTLFIEAYYSQKSNIMGNELIYMILGLLNITIGILGYIKYSVTVKILSALYVLIAVVLLFF